MKESDLLLLREICLLLDLAYIHHFEATGDTRNVKSAEGTVRLEFGNFWYRKEHQPTPPGPPEIETVVIYSSVFSANRIVHADTLNDALELVRGWYEQAKAKRDEIMAERDSQGDNDVELP